LNEQAAQSLKPGGCNLKDPPHFLLEGELIIAQCFNTGEKETEAP
jgi:hypothetical protein